MGDVRKLWIEGPAGRLEAALRLAVPARAVAVVAHPHPLYGGTLHNPVVFHSDRALNRAGLTTLRFNFRGVGSSEGEHDGGDGEVEDVAAAVSWLRGLALEIPVIVVGYSFGSWCGIRHAAANPTVRGVVALGLPVNRFDFADLSTWKRPLAVVQGDADEFGSLDEVGALLAGAAGQTETFVVPDARHLFTGRAQDAAAAVARATEWLLPRAG